MRATQYSQMHSLSVYRVFSAVHAASQMESLDSNVSGQVTSPITCTPATEIILVPGLPRLNARLDNALRKGSSIEQPPEKMLASQGQVDKPHPLH